MDFQTAVKTCLTQKYFDFNGRASRSEFWWFFLAQLIVFLISSVVASVLYLVAVVALFLPGLGASVRRLHDIGKSGWWILVGFIPLIGWIILIYWAVQPGEPNANAYGEPTGGPAPALKAPGEV